jgi:hypothetical protein
MAHLYLSDFETDNKVRRIYAGSLVITLHHLMDMLIFRYWFLLHFSPGQMLPIGDFHSCERVLIDVLKVGATCLFCIIRSFAVFYLLHFIKSTLGL